MDGEHFVAGLGPRDRTAALRAGALTADTALLAYYNQASGQWQPVSATYHPAASTLTAAVGHLSILSVLQLAGQRALNSAPCPEQLPGRRTSRLPARTPGNSPVPG